MRLADYRVNNHRLLDLDLRDRFVTRLVQHVGEVAAQSSFE